MARHSMRKQTSGVYDLTGAGRILHWLGMLAMVVGMLAPLVGVDTAAATPMSPERARLAAAQQPLDRDIAGFDRVVATGDFQGQFGCSGWDVNCDQTRLQDNNGFWTGVFPVPPGTWNWELVGLDSSGTQYSLGSNQVSVGEDQSGIYFEFDSASRQNNVWAVTSVATVSGPFGTVALAQDGDGFVASSLNVDNDGPVDMQVNLPEGQVPANANLSRGANKINFDASGNLTNVQPLGFAEVVIGRVDADGNPLSGSCFMLDGATEGRGCDSDDGSADGTTTIQFPGGFEPGSYTLRETTAADGAEPVADQPVDVQQGESAFQVQSEGAATGDIVVLRQDESGGAVGGACVEVIDAGGNSVDTACDEDGDVADDGRIGIFDVPVGDYTVNETRTPDGYEQASNVDVTVLADETVTVEIQGAAIVVEEPTDEVAEVGDLVIIRTNGDGDPVGGSCFAVIDADGNTVGEQCDEDGDVANDGRTGIFDIRAGNYTLRETRAPDGYDQAPDKQITLQAGPDNEVTVSANAIEQPTEVPTDEPADEPTEEPTDEPTDEVKQPGNLVITRTDANDNPVGGSCFAVIDADGNTVGEQCDEDGFAPDDGTTGIYDIPEGDYTLRESRTPQGQEQAPDTPITITPGIDNEVTVSAALSEQPTAIATEEPTAEPPTDGAALTMTFPYEEGQPQTCIELDTGGSIGMLDIPFACDNGENDADPAFGVIRLENLTAGEFVVDVYQGPDELVQAEPRPVTLVDGETANIEYEALQPALTSFVIQTTDGTDPVGGACYQVDDRAIVCDDGTGSLTIANNAPGDHTVTMTSAPDGFDIADPQTVSVATDGSTQATFTLARSTTSFVIQTTDGTDPVGGACYQIDDREAVCDDGTGSLTIADMVPGDHTVTMTSAPDGFDITDPQTVSVATDGSTQATFTLARSTTSFIVQTTDGTDPVGGACYQIDDRAIVCDDGTGSLTIANNAPGDHTVTMTSAPDGFDITDPQTVSVATDGSTQATFTMVLSAVSIDVNTSDAETGEVLTDACYALDGGEQVCDDEANGQVVFQGMEPGEYSLTMTSAPEGYDPAPEQIIAADTTVVDVELQAQTGSLTVSIVDESDNSLPGACISLDSGEPVCDDDNNGIFEFPALALGGHSVTVTTVPAGYDKPAEPQTITIEADGSVTLTFQITATVPTTGGLDVTIIYSDDSPVEGACITATLSGGTPITICDGGEGDSNPDAGVVGFDDLVAGTYEVGLAEGSEIERPTDVTIPISVTVEAGARASATLIMPLAPETGSLQIVTSADGSNVEGACFTVGDVTVCDNDGSDVDGTVGVVQLNDLDPGDYQVTMSTVPNGFELPAAQTATITAGETTRFDFELTRVPQPGSITVSTTDSDGNPLANACYAVVQSGTRIATLCDTDPDGGNVVFENVPAGTYQVVQTQAPGRQYQTAPTQTVEVRAGEDTQVDIVMDLRPGRLTVVTADRDEPTLILENACYTLIGASEFGPFCDADDGNVDGRVVFTNLPAGDYELRQTVASAGYEPAGNRTITIAAGGSLQVTVLNAKVQPPAESGTLVVIPLDPNGNPVAGGCYQLFDGDAPVTQRVCDNADDQPAKITFTDLPVGDFTLRETVAPSPDWRIADDIAVTIRDGETTTVRIPHEFKNGTVVVQAVSTVGLPLQNACFTLTDAGDVELCTDASGQATITDLTPGTRDLTQTQAPFGFKLNKTPREVVVRPGQTTTSRVVFENEPPPNTGTVQVQKFVCPAGDEGDRTIFLGGAQGNNQLKQTAGCVPAVATFKLEAEDGGNASNTTFKTNTDGRAQVTAKEGIYLLTETDPNLAGNSSARIRVGTGQMTTVIVMNFIAPPAPAPVTINIEGYTCPPGFNGSSFADFQNSCMATSQLTNQITVRAEGANRYKRVTGDTGVVGKTSFVDLTAGTYTIWAERPYAVPLTYMFCGADPDNPALKAVNGSVVTTQESGSTITCRIFQVPSLFDADNGAIQVQKYNCPIDERQRGYDYKDECERAVEPIPFVIQRVDPKTKDLIGDPVQVSTNSDGIVQFPMLTPGTYKLTEVGGQWCFAQSNSVDSAGDVIVNANKLSEVWVYNCVGTTAPPNTGSGDAADLLNPDEGVGPMQVLPNLLWPSALLLGWMIRRERYQR